MQDPNPRMRVMALWVSESFIRQGTSRSAEKYLDMMSERIRKVKMRR